jgi:hypothetical protein
VRRSGQAFRGAAFLSLIRSGNLVAMSVHVLQSTSCKEGESLWYPFIVVVHDGRASSVPGSLQGAGLYSIRSCIHACWASLAGGYDASV